MATPADQPISQRYTAGTCTLNVEWQPSPLSQWSDRPIASRLSFELRLQTEADSGIDKAEDTPRGQVLAQGDRDQLQAITQYIQNQVRSTLALTQISSASPKNRHQSLQLSDPLSYLQLCDINTVLSQFEQTASILPPGLSDTPEVPPISPSKVIFLEATRRTRPPQQRNSRNPKIWASSAAAAVFAVGLTTTLWSRDLALKPVNTATDSTEPTAPAEVLEEARPSDENEASSNPSVTGDREESQNLSQSATEPAPTETRRPPNRPAAEEPADTSTTDTSTEDLAGRSPAAVPETDRPDISQPAGSAASSSTASSSATPPSTAARQSEALIPELSEPAATSAIPESNPIVSPEAQRVVGQVQRYLQQQWQSSGGGPLASPLTYRLQLSDVGDVVSFTALDETSVAYRDRLLPLESSPTFATAPSAENPQALASELDLRIIVNRNGVVEVSPF